MPGNEDTIETLRLNLNQINYIEPGAFDKFTSLKNLDLSFNKLITINFIKDIGKSLEELNLNSNFLPPLSPNVFMHLKNLKKLELGASQLFGRERNKHIFDWLGGVNGSIFTTELSNLELLNLHGLNITHLEKSFYVNLK